MTLKEPSPTQIAARHSVEPLHPSLQPAVVGIDVLDMENPLLDNAVASPVRVWGGKRIQGAPALKWSQTVSPSHPFLEFRRLHDKPPRNHTVGKMVILFPYSIQIEPYRNNTSKRSYLTSGKKENRIAKDEKEYNRALSCIRVKVENAIRRPRIRHQVQHHRWNHQSEDGILRKSDRGRCIRRDGASNTDFRGRSSIRE